MRQLLWITIAIAGLVCACKKNNDKPGTAIVTTTAPGSITASSAQTGGDITSNGNSAISESGICWAVRNAPTLGDSVVNSNTTSTGVFSVNLNNLNANTVYYIRAFVTNGVGTGYGAVDSFTTAAGVPSLSTTAISNNQALSAQSGGTIINNGGAAVTSSGICWSTSANPTISGSNIAGTATSGSFSDTLTNLTLGTTYYVRAYATNSYGTGYGNQISFTVSTTGTVKDIDGNVYATITIGTQTWMLSNLRVTHYQNGDSILNAYTDPQYDWFNGTTAGGYIFVNGDSTTKAMYGLLYSNFAVNDSRNIAPAGWHAATDDDWDTLEVFEGMPAADTALTGPNGTISAALQVGGSSGLNLQLPGVFYAPTTGYYYYQTRGYYWTSTMSNTNVNYFREFYGPTSANYQAINRNYGADYGFSVRCVKN